MTVKAAETVVMSDGFNLAYRCWPAKDVERVVVCIHGIGDHSGWFGNLALDLAADGSQVYALDLRGFGSSLETGLPRGYPSSFMRHLNDIDEAVRQFQSRHPSKKLFVLGHSLGGVYALWYAANHPSAVSGLLLAAPAVQSALNTYKSSVQLFLPNLLCPKRAHNPFKATNCEGRDPEEIQIMLNDPQETNALPFRYLTQAKRILVDRAFKNAARITKPTLILEGAADTVVFRQGIESLYAQLAAEDTSLEVFSDAGHWFYDVFSPVAPRTRFSSKNRSQVISVVKVWLSLH